MFIYLFFSYLMRSSIADYLFFVYLTIPSIGKIMQRRMTWLLVNNELEWMWEKTVVA
jgi:hypothetical protein